MTAMLSDTSLTWADVLRTWHELETPEGWRPEITPENIVMTPPPSADHNVIDAILNRILVAAVDDKLGVFHTLGVAVPSVGGIFIPDLCVVELDLPQGTEPVDSEQVLLAVEITSRSNAQHDRKRKKWAYAHGGIAQYLLVDVFDEDGPAVSLFSEPSNGVYGNMVRISFGQKITLAEPIRVVIDTASFPTGLRTT